MYLKENYRILCSMFCIMKILFCCGLEKVSVKRDGWIGNFDFSPDEMKLRGQYKSVAS